MNLNGLKRRLEKIEKRHGTSTRLLCVEWWEGQETAEEVLADLGIETQPGDMIVGLVPLDDAPPPKGSPRYGFVTDCLNQS